MLSATDPQHTSNSSNSLQPRHYLLFVVFIAIIGAFSSLVNDMYLPTIPAMRREFHTTPSMTQMGLSLAMLGMGLGSIVWGSLSDPFGETDSHNLAGHFRCGHRGVVALIHH